MTRHVDQNWQLLQQTTFTKWVNNALRGHLKTARTQVSDLQKDLRDGLVLVELLESIASPRKVGRHNRKPVIKPQMLENLGAVLRLLEREQIKVVNIGPEDIYSGNLKLIMGLIWTLIRHFQIRSSGKDLSTKNALLAWINTQIPDQKVTNFTTDWNDGIALSALVDRIRPGLCPHYATLRRSEGLDNCQLGMDIAEEELGIPKLLEASDLCHSDVDELSVMTYVSYFCKPANEQLLRWIQSKIPQRKITNFKKDWNNGINLACLVNNLVPGIFPDCEELDPHDSLQNLTRAMKLAEERLGVKPVIKPSQLADPKVDELNVATYLSRFQYAKFLAYQPKEVSCTGHGLQKAFIGRPTFFQVDSSTAGVGVLNVSIISMGGTPVAADINPHPTQKGVFEVQYTPNRAGELAINISWSDQQVPGSPFVVDILDPSGFSVSGNQVTEGQCARVGKPVRMDVKGMVNIADLSVTIQHSDAHTTNATVTPKGIDAFECCYTPTRVGTDDVMVKIAGENIPGSPFTVRVVDPSRCSVSHREPTAGKRAQANSKVTFTVTASESNLPGVIVELKTPTGQQELALEPRGDGINIGSFVPETTGNYSIIVTCAGENLRGSPLSIVVTDPSKCAILDMIPRYLQLNRPVELNISTKGAGQGILESSSNQSGILATSLTERDSEFYSLRLTPHAIGEATIAITWNADNNLSNTPFGVFVCDASKCSAYGPGLTEGKGKVGETFEFTVQAARAGRGELVVNPSGKKAVYGTKIRDGQNGTHSVQFTSYEPGPHTIEVLWGGEPIPNSPFKVDFFKSMEATQFSALGEGLENIVAMQIAKFSIQGPASGTGLVWKEMLKVKVSGETTESVTVISSAFGPSTVKPVVCITEIGSGAYTVEYVVPEVGEYSLAVTCDGDHIPGSPFAITAFPTPEASHCTILGEAIDDPTSAVVGKPLDFQVDSSKAGTGTLKVTATDPASKTMPIYLAEDNTPDGNRVHTVKIFPTLQGSHKITVQWCEKDIPGSPFYVDVGDPKNVAILNLPDAQTFIAEVNEPFSFEIDPRKAGKGEIKAAYKMEDGIMQSIEVTEQEQNGTYLAKCVPKEAGTMELLLTFSGANILPVPWVCNVANLSLFQVNHPKGYGRQKECVKFVITGLTKKNLSNMAITAKHPQHNATVKVEYGRDRTAVVRFTPKHVGEYRCEVLCGKKHIQGSPFYVLVANPDECTIDGKIPSVIPISQNAEILVNAKDAGPGELSFSAETSGGESSSCLECEMRIQSTDPTSQQVVLKGIHCGKCNVVLKWANYNIPGIPVEIDIVDPQKCTFSCTSLTGGPIKLGNTVEVDIDTTHSGNCLPRVAVTGPKAECPVELSEQRDGKYLAKFSPFEEGDHTLDVTVGGARIAGRPTKFEVIKPIDPSKITVGGPGLKGAVANRRADLTVFARESKLIERGVLTADFKTTSTSSLKDVDYPTVDCKDNGNGTYNLSFIPKTTGVLQLSIKTEGTQVLGSPFNIRIRPEPNAHNCTISGKVIDDGFFAVIREQVELTVDTSSAGSGSLSVSGVQPDHTPLRIFASEERTGQKTLHFLKFDPVLIGTHLVSVKWEGEEIPGVPLSITVLDPLKCSIEDSLPTCLKIGASHSLAISTAGAGEAELKPRVTGTGLTVICEQHNPDVCTVTLSAVQFGEVEVDLRYGGFSIPASPFTVSVCDPSKCSIDTEAMTSSKNLFVGVPFNFTVTATGAGRAKLQVKPSTAKHQYTIDIESTAEEECYSVTCTPWNVGEQDLEITFGQTAIPGSPLQFAVSDPKKCVITGLPDPKQFIPIVGEPIFFAVDSTCAGPGALTALATSADELTEEFESTETGTVASFSYLPKRPGTLEFTLEFNGVSILSRPWVSEVPDPSKFRVTPPKGYGKKREYVTFLITGLTEGTKNIKLKAAHPDHDATVKMEPGKDDGTIIARFTAKHVGEYTVQVSHSGQHIEGSPFTVSVCDPDACQVTNPPPSALHIGVKQVVSVNTSAAGPGELSVFSESLSGDIEIEAEAKTHDEFGNYSIEFLSNTKGSGRLRALWGGYNIPSATYEISFVDSSQVMWSSKPDLLTDVVTQGEKICIDINGREGGKTVPKLNLTGSQSSFAVEVISNNDGTFTANVNTWQVGQNTIEILWGDQPIPNTPISFNVVKSVDARSVTATGEGLKHAVTGIPAQILIRAPETGLLDRGLLALTCKSSASDEEDEEDSYLPSIDIADDGDGQYSASLLASHEGTYYLSIVCNNQPIYGSPFAITVQAAANASKCRAFGAALRMLDSGLTVADPVEFSVDTTDAGFGQLSVSIKKPDGGTSRVYSLEEHGARKIHHLKFDPDMVGHYTMDVMWGDSHIPNSPFNFNITDSTKCSASGMPSFRNIFDVNQYVNFTILTKEAGDGVPNVTIHQPGGAGEVTLSSSETSPSVHEYNFTTTVLGTHSIIVEFGGRPIPGSPFHFQVIDPTKFSITDLNLKGKYALVCELVSFRVQGKAPQNENLLLVAHGPSADLTIENQKQSDGSYTCSFVPIEPGSYEVFVECAGKHVNGSPFSVLVADPSKCQILGTLADTIQVGEPDEIVVKTRGAGAGDIQVYLDGETENDAIEYSVENQGLDTYSITLTGKKVCQAKVGIHWGGFSIPQAPFPLTVCDASLCKAFGNVLMTKKGNAGEQITFTVVTHRAGQAILRVKATGPSAMYTVDVKLIKECTYEASFTAWEIGEHSIDVFWGSMHIPKSPFIVNVANPMDRLVCNATGPGLKHAISTQPATFTIISNEVGLLDKNALKVSVIGVQSHADITIKDKNNGCYEVTYTAPTAGAYIASVSFYDRQIPGSPFKINVVPGPDASRCRAYGPALHPSAIHIAGTPLELNIDCSEGGYGSLRVYVQGPNDYRPRIYMADDGKGVYSVKFDAMRAGKYFLVIAWADNHIPGSPFKLKVHPAADPSKVKVYGPGITDGRVGDEGEFTIDTKLAGIGTLLLRVHGIRDSFKIEAHPVSIEKPRLLAASYHPAVSGEYTIFVRWSGVHVPGSPFTILIREADGSLPLLGPYLPEHSAEDEPLAALEAGPGESTTDPKSGKKAKESRKEEKESAKAKKASAKAAAASLKKEEKARKKAEKEKKKNKTIPPHSIGPVPTDLKMRSSPMGGFTVQPGHPLPPGALIAPDGQLVVRSPSGQFIPVQLMFPQQHHKMRVMTEKHHSGSDERDEETPSSPAHSPPVSPTHGATFDPNPQHQPQPKKKRRKF